MRPAERGIRLLKKSMIVTKKLIIKTFSMTATNSRNEEVKRRILEWEQENNKQLQECSREEWIEAMQGIMAMTRKETEEYLDHLLAQRSGS